ncbi:MAG: glycosyltransferase [Bacteroidota bacterium]
MILTAAGCLFLFGVFYVAFLWYIRSVWPTDPEVVQLSTSDGCSIVIVARNEEHHIAKTLRAVHDSASVYGQHEIILVDDHSEDRTVNVARSLDISNLRVLQLREHISDVSHKAFKKAGQHLGISQASYPIILTTDADCEPGRYWVNHMVHHLQHADIVTGTIQLSHDSSLLGHLQAHDVRATMMTTQAGIHNGYWYSANAANMAFRKEDYLRYAKQMDYSLASGDDVAFVQWAANQDAKVEFCVNTSAAVLTPAEDTWTSFFRQRVRWATKTTGYKHRGLLYLWTSLYVVQIMFVVGLVLCLWSGLLGLLIATVSIALKAFVDRSAITPKKTLYPIWMAPLLSIIHSLYVVFIGLQALFQKNYIWKGRRVS